jgi:hypothetical protein
MLGWRRFQAEFLTHWMQARGHPFLAAEFILALLLAIALVVIMVWWAVDMV